MANAGKVGGYAKAPGVNPQAGTSKGGGKGDTTLQSTTGGTKPAKPSSKVMLTTKGTGNRF